MKANGRNSRVSAKRLTPETEVLRVLCEPAPTTGFLMDSYVKETYLQRENNATFQHE